MAMLEVKDLRTSFFTPAGEVKAVNGLYFAGIGEKGSMQIFYFKQSHKCISSLIRR